VDWERVCVEGGDRRFVTFINPSLQKGVFPFARMAAELGRRRPDIPLLVVESRGKRAMLAACGVDPAALVNLHVMANTTDPRRFWSMTKIALLPSLWFENQPLTAIEAMINGIPVIGSDRGGIPETLGDGGIVLPLPKRLTPLTRTLPTAEEVEPWVEAIIRLWDGRAWYNALSARARNEAERWRPERLRPLYAEFFQGVQRQQAAPLVASIVRCPLSVVRCMDSGGPAAPAGSAVVSHTRGAKPTPLSFVVCVSDDAVLKANLLASPALASEHSPHEVILIHKAPSAAAALNVGLERARNEWVACVHQHCYLPFVRVVEPLSLGGAEDAPDEPGGTDTVQLGWDEALFEQLRTAEERFGPIGVAGVYGVGEVIGGNGTGSSLAAERIGWVVDRGRALRDGPELPARVATLDELLLVVRRDSGLRFDPELGFHLYGADLCLQARERGLAVVAVAALCYHNSRTMGIPKSFHASAAVFARKWAHRLPVATPCALIDRNRSVHLLGNAQEGSIAYARTAAAAIVSKR
jgi:hypothetical protein